MASYEQRGRTFRIIFRFRKIKYKRTLKNVQGEPEADAAVWRVEEKLKLIKAGVLVPPEGVDLVTFLLGDEARPLPTTAATVVNSSPALPTPEGQLTLAELFGEYFAKLPNGNLEATTVSSMKIHQRQLEKRLGKGFLINGLTATHLQTYIEQRSRDDGRNGRKLSPATIKKAIVTLRTVWNWGRRHQLTSKEYPSGGLKYPKGKEKPPFMTFAEIERRAKKVSPADAADLWECVFLSLGEIDELLTTVRERAQNTIVYPLFVFAAHTGARRSEMVRSVLTDLDFDTNRITIHERKKSHKRCTTRQVSMSPLLHSTLTKWLDSHPGGDYTFSQYAAFRRDGDRPLPLTVDKAHDHFRDALDGTKWSRLRGWHVFRHSFCSNCAAKGIDQRIIDAWVGHLSEDMVRRYRHLLPDQHQTAIKAVFGTAHS